MTWTRRFDVRGSKGDVWTVALDDRGKWGCSCPKWKFAKRGADGKPDCHHIAGVKDGLRESAQRDRAVVVAPIYTRPPVEQHGREVDIDVPTVRALSVGVRLRHLDFDIQVKA